MKRIGVVLAIVLLAGSILSGCVIVPLGGWHGDGGHYRGQPYPRHYGGR